MKVFLAGATGAIGRPLTGQLLAAGHEVVAMTRSEQSAAELQQRGAAPVVCDVFDRAALYRCLRDARPDVVIHQLTALPRRLNPRKIDTQLAATNRLRIEGTWNLHEAARAAGVQRFIAQSIAFAYDPAGPQLTSENCPLYKRPPKQFAKVIAAVRRLEETVLGSEDLPGMVLRYGFFYGPGTSYAADGAMAADVRARRVPIIGNGAGVFSFIHVDDAAAATLAAVDHGESGIYNIVDDDPAAVSEWLPYYAEQLGAPSPRRIPRWLAKILAGPYAVYIMCEQPGAANARAKRQLGWSPRYASWRTGFAELAGKRDKSDEPPRDFAAA